MKGRRRGWEEGKGGDEGRDGEKEEGGGEEARGRKRTGRQGVGVERKGGVSREEGGGGGGGGQLCPFPFTLWCNLVLLCAPLD